MNERHQLILELISSKKKISVNELSKITGVSVVTIRHDLNYLEQQSYIKKYHGYAELLDRDNVGDRVQINFSVKQSLAKYAATLIKNGDCIFIEGGSTNALLARELLSFDGELVVITICTYIASLLKEASFDVILLGGLLQSKSENLVGPLTKIGIMQTHFNKAFLGIDGYHPDSGFTGRDMMRADVINCVIDKGTENIIIADSSKFGQIFSYTLSIGSTSAVSQIITDNNLDKNIEHRLMEKNILIYKVRCLSQKPYFTVV